MQTLRREQRLKFKVILKDYIQEDMLDEVVNKLADSTTQKKGDLIDGMLAYSKNDKSEEIDVVLSKLDKTFNLNLPRSPEWQSLAKWILTQTNPTLNQWITWYIQDEFRMTTSIHITPDKIRMWWPKAHVTERPKPAPKVEEPENYVNMIEWKKEHRK